MTAWKPPAVKSKRTLFGNPPPTPKWTKQDLTLIDEITDRLRGRKSRKGRSGKAPALPNGQMTTDKEGTKKNVT